MVGADFSLSGRNAVVAGGAGILGSRISLALAGAGARVAVIDRDRDRVQAIARSGPAGAIKGITADLGTPAGVGEAKRQVESEVGAVDVLVNALATKSEKFFEPFEAYALEDWDQVIRVNLTGPMLCCQAFGADMARRGRGSIVNILSIYGLVAPDQRIYEGSEYEGRPINSPPVYAASKAGLWGLTKFLAAYWAEKGVRVNAITPGGVFSGQNDVFVGRYSARVPMGRMANQDEMSGAVVFLASDASSYVTGHNLVVDGGLTVW
jgi:NAD(P)-dependent dehydrogenase (short-subunit alcohol dehydrogenase family)